MAILNKRQRKVWYYLILQLGKSFCPGVPVTVRSTRMSDKFCGDCTGVIKLGRMVQIKIRINSDSPWNTRLETLIHEWAHAMEWEANWCEGGPKREHGPTWGVWYASIYEHVFDVLWDEWHEKNDD